MISFEFGNSKPNSFSMSFGRPELEITEEMKEKTLKQIAKELAKQMKLKNGEIEFYGINFTFKMQAEEKNSPRGTIL